MNFLCLLWSSGDSSSNSPHWLISDDYARPVGNLDIIFKYYSIMFLDEEIMAKARRKLTVIKGLTLSAIALSCLKQTSFVFPACLSSNFSPMHGMILRPCSRANATFSPKVMKLVKYICCNHLKI